MSLVCLQCLCVLKLVLDTMRINSTRSETMNNSVQRFTRNWCLWFLLRSVESDLSTSFIADSTRSFWDIFCNHTVLLYVETL